MHEGAAAAEERLRELTGTLERERVRAAGLEQAQARTQELEGELRLAIGRADKAEREVELAATEADKAENQLRFAVARADKADGELRLAVARADKAETELRVVSARVVKAESDAQAASGRAAKAEEEVERWRVRVDKAEEEIERWRARVDKAEGDVEQWRTRAQQAETELARGNARVEGLDTELARGQTRVEQLEAELKVATRRAEDAERDALLGQARAHELAGEAERGQGRIQELENAVESGQVRMRELEGDVQSGQARVQELQSEVASGQARVQQLEGEVESGRAKAEEADATIAELEEQLGEAPEPGPDPAVTVAEEASDPEDGASGAETPLPTAELATLEAVADHPRPPTGSGVSWHPTAKRTLAASLARESVWRNVLKETVQVLGSEGGWDTVTAWLPDESDGLGCAATWAAHRGLDRFESLTWETGLKRDGSLLDQALQAPHLTWLTDIDAVDDERLQTAAAHGMSSALLLPVRNGASTIGLLELLTHDSIEPDAQIALSLEASALQLGRFGHLLSLSK